MAEIKEGWREGRRKERKERREMEIERKKVPLKYSSNNNSSHNPVCGTYVFVIFFVSL